MVFFTVTGLILWMAIAAFIAYTIIIGVVKSASLHRWHLARIHARGETLKLRHYPAFFASFVAGVIDLASWRWDTWTTYSAHNAVWNGVGDWHVYGPSRVEHVRHEECESDDSDT